MKQENEDEDNGECYSRLTVKEGLCEEFRANEEPAMLWRTTLTHT